MKHAALVAVGLVLGAAVVASGQDTTTLLTFFLRDLAGGAVKATKPSGGSTAASLRLADASATSGRQRYRLEINDASNNDVSFRRYNDADDTAQAAVWKTDADVFTVGQPTVIEGTLTLNATAFASLGTPSNGVITYCNDCTIANPCAGSGTGALAKRLNGVWVCN